MQSVMAGHWPNLLHPSNRGSDYLPAVLPSLTGVSESALGLPDDEESADESAGAAVFVTVRRVAFTSGPSALCRAVWTCLRMVALLGDRSEPVKLYVTCSHKAGQQVPQTYTCAGILNQAGSKWDFPSHHVCYILLGR